MDTSTLCPFSKPIIGQWCACQHSALAERCAGKLYCDAADSLRPSCLHLEALLKQHSRFVLGRLDEAGELTHAQSMKIRCGGVLGMQRLLQPTATGAPQVPELILAAKAEFNSLDQFPFDRIMQDIRSFSHRSSRRKND